MSEELWTIYQTAPQYFTPRSVPPKTGATFEKKYSVDVRDFNTAGVVAAHLGMLLEELQGGEYEVHSTTVSVKNERVAECVASVEAVVKAI